MVYLIYFIFTLYYSIAVLVLPLFDFLRTTVWFHFYHHIFHRFPDHIVTIWNFLLPLLYNSWNSSLDFWVPLSNQGTCSLCLLYKRHCPGTSLCFDQNLLLVRFHIFFFLQYTFVSGQFYQWLPYINVEINFAVTTYQKIYLVATWY